MNKVNYDSKENKTDLLFGGEKNSMDQTFDKKHKKLINKIISSSCRGKEEALKFKKKITKTYVTCVLCRKEKYI